MKRTPRSSEPAGDQQLPSLRAVAVEFSDRFGLARDVERIGRLELHAVGQFETLDPGFELGVVLAAFEVTPVHLLQQVDLPALGRAVQRVCC